MNAEERLFYEDFRPGDTATYTGPEVTADAIIRFAEVFDPQPMHLDPQSAQASFTGGLIASGWHTASLHMRMMADDFINRAVSMGSPGLDYLKWLRPVRPGDRLSGAREVVAARPSRSKDDRGFVTFRFTVYNQNGDAVMEQQNPVLIGRRTPVQAAAENGNRNPEPKSAAPRLVTALEYFGEGRPGDAIDLGTYTFTEDKIIDFARQFDPQYFHIDPQAAKDSHFGGLIASGWQTASVWMRLLLDARAKAEAKARAAGVTLRVLGVSPGFKALRWLAPVRAGATLRYRSSITDIRASGSRPGWVLISQNNQAFAEDGKLVFDKQAAVFAKA